LVDGNSQELCVTNLQIKEVHSPEELHKLFQIAQRNRTVAATQSNERYVYFILSSINYSRKFFLSLLQLNVNNIYVETCVVCVCVRAWVRTHTHTHTHIKSLFRT